MSKSDTVTLTRVQYEALLDQIEDAEDRVAVAAAEAREKALGKKVARADALPLELVRALSNGTHPVRVWRMHRGFTQDALAEQADIAQSYLNEIETRKKSGSLETIIKLAAALNVSLDDLAAWFS